jgi:predicted RNA-binding Zn ribbon-like protein
MKVLWNRHRFSGGLLILDTTNTVVLRGDPMRTFDRFEDADEITRYASAASDFRSSELGGRRLSFERSEAAVRKVMEFREAVDRLFRSAAMTGVMRTLDLSTVLCGCSVCLEDIDEAVGGLLQPFGDPSQPLRLEAALAVSALSLLAGDRWRRIRICPNCNWLFLDRSRNASRLWCDMSVCGNRHKARQHYARRKATEREAENV